MANQGWNSSGSAFDPAYHGVQGGVEHGQAPGSAYHPHAQQPIPPSHPHPAQAPQSGGYYAPHHAQAGQDFSSGAPGAAQHYQQQSPDAPHDAPPSPYYGAAPQGAGPAGDPRIAKVVHSGGAVLSLALIIGLGVWGYNLAVRDSSEVPVVAALEGPMRVQPEEPGGQAANHQGLAVNAVAEGGVAEGPASQVMLAPSAEELTAVDTPVRPVQRPAEADEEIVASAAADPEVLSAISADLGSEGTAAAAQAFVEAITQGTAPLSGEEVARLQESEAAARIASIVGEDVETQSAQVGEEAEPAPQVRVAGVNVSPVPQRRPAGLVTRAAATPAAAPLASAAQVSEVSASSIPKGTRLVQLGAFDSQEVARAEWEKLAGRFDEYLEGKSRVIEKAQSGGKTFYRLRAMGFDDVSDARRFCSALMAGKAACIPVVTR